MHKTSMNIEAAGYIPCGLNCFDVTYCFIYSYSLCQKEAPEKNRI